MKRLATLALCCALAAACGKGDRNDPPAGADLTGAPAAGGPRPPATPPANDSALRGPAGDAGAATTPPAPLTAAQVDELGERMLSVIEAVAAAIEASGTDCAKMATAVDQVMTERADTLAAIRAQSQAAVDDTRLESWVGGHQDRVQAAIARLGPGMKRCGADPRLQDAFSRLDM
jgi:hypothetical protein